MKHLVFVVLCWALILGASSEGPPQLRLQVSPPQASLFVNEQQCSGSEGVYSLPQNYFGRDIKQKATLVLRYPGFEERSLGSFSYEDVKHGLVPSGPHQLKPSGWQGQAWFATGAFLLGLVGLGQFLQVARTRRQNRQRDSSLMSMSRAADFNDPLVGTRLGGYQLLSRLGQGGMATVYRAMPVERVTESEAVALKVIRADHLTADFKLRFEREIRVSSKLDHPNVLRVIDWGQEASVIFLVMELVDGKPLSQLIPPGGLPLNQALEYLGGILEGLAYAHSRGIVHRDLKPENVMVTSKGRVKLMDFGLARSREVKTVTVTGTVLGTPAYMAPEQILNGPRRDALTDRSDQYALAVLTYEIVSSRLPFESDNPMTLIMAHINDPPRCILEFRSGLPERFADGLLKMLAKSPGERFESVREAGRVLLSACQHLTPATTTSLHNLELISQPQALSETIEVQPG